MKPDPDQIPAEQTRDLRARTFHHFRRGASNRNLSWFGRIWRWHDANPLPAALNRWVRHEILFRVRRIQERLRLRKDLRVPVGEQDPQGDLSVPDERLLDPRHRLETVTLRQAEDKLRKIETINELLFQEGRGWVSQPHANHASKGVAIEEIGCRFLGYHYAYLATRDGEWRARAERCIDLLAGRMFAKGHLLLKGHLVIDTTYALAAHCFWLWSEASDDEAAGERALQLSASLREFQIAGSHNHGIAPCIALAEAYRRTADASFLRAAIRRVERTALRSQLAYGGWAGHEQWIWYHSIITASLAKTYAAIPFTLDDVRVKDRMARCLYRAVNRIILAQREDGSLRPGRGTSCFTERDEFGVSPSEQVVRFDENARTFVPAGKTADFPSCGWEMLNFQILLEELDLLQLAPLIRGFVSFVTHQQAYWRFEFQTMAAGIGLYLLKALENHPYERLSKPAPVPVSDAYGAS